MSHCQPGVQKNAQGFCENSSRNVQAKLESIESIDCSFSTVDAQAVDQSQLLYSTRMHITFTFLPKVQIQYRNQPSHESSLAQGGTMTRCSNGHEKQIVKLIGLHHSLNSLRNSIMEQKQNRMIISFLYSVAVPQPRQLL
jgi:hypothetical protein